MKTKRFIPPKPEPPKPRHMVWVPSEVPVEKEEPKKQEKKSK